MIETMRKAKSLSYVSHYKLEVEGRTVRECNYRVWLKKPNYFRVETENTSLAMMLFTGKKGGTLIGDGETLWIYWPEGPPRMSLEDKDDRQTRLKSYMTKPAPPGGHSIGHEVGVLGTGLTLLTLDPSTFHGHTDSAQKFADGVKGLGVEKVGTEDCDKIEVSIMNGQRSRCFWLSQRDRLPRKLKEIVRVRQDLIQFEEWSSVTLDADIPDTMFAWKPPEGWQEWRMPSSEEYLLKPGAEAPDFDLASAGEERIKLSELRGRIVLLTIWKVGCPTCREDMSGLQKLHMKYKDKGLVIVGLNVVDDKKVALEFIADNHATFPNALDTSDAAKKVCHRDYGAFAVPAYYIIGRDGRIVEGWLGDKGGLSRANTVLRNLGINVP